MDDVEKRKQHYYEDEYEVEFDDAEYYGDEYPQSGKGSKGRRPHFPDFEYIEIGYKSSKRDKTGKSSKNSYYDVDDDDEKYDCEGSKFGKSFKHGRPCGPIKRPSKFGHEMLTVGFVRFPLLCTEKYPLIYSFFLLLLLLLLSQKHPPLLMDQMIDHVSSKIF
jgi:hypothetical protein